MASHPRKPSPRARKELKDPALQVAEPNGVTPDSAPPERSRKARDETAAQEENSIRARRARIRAAPREEGKPQPTEVPRTTPVPDSRALPEHVSARYIKVGNKYHFPNGDLAFSDRGRGLSTRLENTEVIRDLIAIAKERGWNTIALRGTDRFRKEAWQQAKLASLAVRGYRPSELERAQLARLIARERDAGQGAPSTEYSAASEGPARRPAAAEDAVRAEARARDPGARSRPRRPTLGSWHRELPARPSCGSFLLREDRYPGRGAHPLG